MRHIEYTYIPDCPECSNEAEQRMCYIPGTATAIKPFGKQVRWWECKECGWRSEQVPSDDFEALTERLTASQRIFGDVDRH